MSEDEYLLRFLRNGKAGIRSSYELASCMGVGQKTIGFKVSSLRKKGYLIGSVHGEGYYFISSQDELDETVAHIERRKAGIDRTISALNGAWSEL